jgi:hypothetical protein
LARTSSAPACPVPRTEAQLRTDPRGTATPLDHASSRSEQLGLYAEHRAGGIRPFAADIGHRVKKRGRFSTTTGIVRQQPQQFRWCAPPRFSPRMKLGGGPLAGMPKPPRRGRGLERMGFSARTPKRTFFGFPEQTADESGTAGTKPRRVCCADETGG